jgi:surface polysaccharide O-acyltransferase-like enzyme
MKSILGYHVWLAYSLKRIVIYNPIIRVKSQMMRQDVILIANGAQDG